MDPALDDGVSIAAERRASASQAAVSDSRTEMQSGERRKRRFGLRVLAVTLVTALLAGTVVHFVLFANRIAGVQVPHTANADAIVVLTGGHARVNEAVRLLEEGRANRLLISGVHPGTTREQLAAVTSSRMPLKKSTVELDRVALNTAGNATETASWVRKNGFSSLLVVTSAYHLPRARVELSGALPKVELIAYPVFSKDLKLEEWYREPATIWLLMREYVKYSVARLRLTLQGVN
ncbi:hypothetical protein OA90_05585 [Labrenzia sp. OB1]|nr:hypothetical protein OA90_05585 [Labrenzia sp. OB1]